MLSKRLFLTFFFNKYKHLLDWIKTNGNYSVCKIELIAKYINKLLNL